MKSPVFWDITPCRPLKVNGRFGETCTLHLQGRRISQASNQREACSKLATWYFLLATFFTLISCLAYSSTLMMQMTCSSETSVNFKRTTRRYIPENRTLHNHRCEYLKSYTVMCLVYFLAKLHIPRSHYVTSSNWKLKTILAQLPCSYLTLQKVMASH
jgi:hypothetical protein